MTSQCCAQRDCSAFHDLTKATGQIKDLEEKNRIAGEYGQALLARHENYVAVVEKERHRMMEKIQTLEQHNVELEAQNKGSIQENRDLLDQLEALNGAVKDSESKAQSLTELLHSTEYELERMNGLAARTSQLHNQLAQLEDDLAAANAVVTATLDENKAATLRWQQAERTISSLQSEIEQIEAEARNERQRHAEVVARVERRKAVETELIKNRPWKDPTESNGVVSNFVKDILQDNANLQLGIMELRDMLQRSNDEVESLRSQAVLSPSISDVPDRSGAQTPSLGAELNSSREVHVHHHYHPPSRPVPEPRKSRAQFQRRKGKQRSSASHTPRSSISMLGQDSSSSSAILSNTSVTFPSRNTKRWSMQSSQTGFTSSSSLPSSPYSESIFDRVYADTATDISRPSSPESDAFSPRNVDSFGVYDSSKRESLASTITNTGAEPFKRSVSDGPPRTMPMKTPPLEPRQDYEVLPSSHSIIFEENEDLESSQITISSPIKLHSSPVKISSPVRIQQSPIRPTIRRNASHESLISIRGMDIHTLQSRPSQLLLGKYVAAPTTSSQTAITDTSAMATRTSSRATQDARASSQSYLSGIAAAQRSQPVRKPSRPSLGDRVGGWMWSKWSSTPAPSVTTATAQSAVAEVIAPSSASVNSTTTTSTTSEHPSASTPSNGTPTSKPTAKRNLSSPRKLVIRSPGINQPGPIFGFAPERKLDPTPVIKSLDVKALRDGLGDDE